MRTKRKFIFFEQSFRKPVATARGDMSGITSLILREVFENGTIGYGEAASIPGFSEFSIDEGLLEAEDWIHGRCKDVQKYRILAPALASLASSVWETAPAVRLPKSAHLYHPEQNITSSTVKRKIGLRPPKQEIDQVLDWLGRLPRQTKVRLDANESFSRELLLKWVDALEGNQKIQFIEQPTGSDDDDWLIDFSNQSSVPIALDESLFRIYNSSLITSLPRSLFLVIKPVLFPNWVKLFSDLEDRMNQVVFSTAFESPFGYESIIRLAADSTQVSGLDRSCFCGNKNEFPQHHQPLLSSPSVPSDKLDRLWQTLHQ